MSIGKFRTLVKKRKEVKNEEANLEKTQLNLKIDANLKRILQQKYGKNLSRMFEENMIEALEKDGYKFDKVKKAE